MTFPIIRSERALGISDAGPICEPGTISFNAAVIDLVALFRLDRRSPERRLACHWAREIDGRLVCHWEPDIVPIPQR